VKIDLHVSRVIHFLNSVDDIAKIKARKVVIAFPKKNE